MKIGIKVGDIMTRDFISVKPETNLRDCANLMTKKRVGSLIVQENGALLGLLTERDILWALTKKTVDGLKLIKAGDLAKKKIATIKPSADLYDALQKMKKSKYRWLPVISKGSVIGFLTLKDILRIEPSLFEIAHAHGAFQIKEEHQKLKRRHGRRTGNEIWTKEGICDECDNIDLLYNIEGKHLCESCKDVL